MKDVKINIKQAAEMLGISSDVLKTRAYRGTVPATKDHGRYQFSLSDLVDIIDRDTDSLIENKHGKLISLPEAAKSLNMAKQTLWARFMANHPPLPVGKLQGKWMFRVRDVAAAKASLAKAGKFLRPLPVQETVTSAMADTGFDIEYETITAQCPYCSIKHETSAAKGSTKWLYCPKHVGFRQYSGSRFEANNTMLRTTEA